MGSSHRHEHGDTKDPKSPKKTDSSSRHGKSSTSSTSKPAPETEETSASSSSSSSAKLDAPLEAYIFEHVRPYWNRLAPAAMLDGVDQIPPGYQVGGDKKVKVVKKITEGELVAVDEVEELPGSGTPGKRWVRKQASTKQGNDWIWYQMTMHMLVGHENIVQMFHTEWDPSSGWGSIYFPNHSGGDLNALIRQDWHHSCTNPPLKLADWLPQLSDQTCDALVWLKKRRIVHNYVAADNVMWDRNPDGSYHFRVGNFKLAVPTCRLDFHAHDPFDTEVKAYLAAAPEMESFCAHGHKGKPYTERADWFSHTVLMLVAQQILCDRCLGHKFSGELWWDKFHWYNVPCERTAREIQVVDRPVLLERLAKSECVLEPFKAQLSNDPSKRLNPKDLKPLVRKAFADAKGSLPIPSVKDQPQPLSPLVERHVHKEHEHHSHSSGGKDASSEHHAAKKTPKSLKLLMGFLRTNIFSSRKDRK